MSLLVARVLDMRRWILFQGPLECLDDSAQHFRLDSNLVLNKGIIHNSSRCFLPCSWCQGVPLPWRAMYYCTATLASSMNLFSE